MLKLKKISTLSLDNLYALVIDGCNICGRNTKSCEIYKYYLQKAQIAIDSINTAFYN